MFSHICLGCRDLAVAARFYRSIAPHLNLIERAVEEDGGPPMYCWHLPGRIAPRLYIVTPFDDAPATAGNGTMVALVAPTQDAVRAAHGAGLENGGTCEGPPGIRAHYAPDYFGAYLRDPDGNKLHFVHRPELVATLTAGT